MLTIWASPVFTFPAFFSCSSNKHIVLSIQKTKLPKR